MAVTAAVIDQLACDAPGHDAASDFGSVVVCFKTQLCGTAVAKFGGICAGIFSTLVRCCPSIDWYHIMGPAFRFGATIAVCCRSHLADDILETELAQSLPSEAIFDQVCNRTDLWLVWIWPETRDVVHPKLRAFDAFSTWSAFSSLSLDAVVCLVDLVGTRPDCTRAGLRLQVAGSHSPDALLPVAESSEPIMRSMSDHPKVSCVAVLDQSVQLLEY